MSARNHRRRIAALALALAAIGAGTALAATEDQAAGPVDPAVADALGASTAPVADVPADIRDSFRMFRERPASGMPDDVAAAVGSSARYGRNPRLARSIDTVTGPGWVIPGDGYLCLAVKSPDGYATACNAVDRAARAGVVVGIGGVLPDDQVAETRVVADGAQVVRSDGTPVPADGGVASAILPKGQHLTVTP